MLLEERFNLEIVSVKNSHGKKTQTIKTVNLPKQKKTKAMILWILIIEKTPPSESLTPRLFR